MRTLREVIQGSLEGSSKKLDTLIDDNPTLIIQEVNEVEGCPGCWLATFRIMAPTLAESDKITRFLTKENEYN